MLMAVLLVYFNQNSLLAQLTVAAFINLPLFLRQYFTIKKAVNPHNSVSNTKDHITLKKLFLIVFPTLSVRLCCAP